ncbi:hypothetical protein [Streptomyces phaeochromogenes]|uniref:hypothetical protein n=1 Tax=Streptomyces phaeochromogenes TaxID=1923 RepID=UPI0033EE9D9F
MTRIELALSAWEATALAWLLTFAQSAATRHGAITRAESWAPCRWGMPLAMVSSYCLCVVGEESCQAIQPGGELIVLVDFLRRPTVCSLAGCAVEEKAEFVRFGKRRDAVLEPEISPEAAAPGFWIGIVQPPDSASLVPSHACVTQGRPVDRGLPCHQGRVHPPADELARGVTVRFRAAGGRPRTDRQQHGLRVVPRSLLFDALLNVGLVERVQLLHASLLGFALPEQDGRARAMAHSASSISCAVMPSAASVETDGVPENGG